MYGLILTSLKRPVSVIMLYLGIMVIGIISGLFLPEEYVPNMAVPKLVVSTVYPAGSPEDVRLLVTIPLEEAFSSLSGLESIKSLSRSGVSTIELEFQWGTDILVAGVKARESIDRTFSSLPEECSKPIVFKIDPNQKPLLIIGVSPVREDLSSLRRRAEREIRTEIQQIQGVGNIVLVGGKKDEIHIDAESARLSSRKINITDLGSYIASENINFPVGTFSRGTKQYILKVKGEAKNLNELKGLKLLNRKTGKIITAGNFGFITFGKSEQKSFFQSWEKEEIGLIVRVRTGENPVEVAKRVKKKIRNLNKNYSRDLKLTVLYDASESIKKSINGLFINLISGGIIAFFVILLFIRNLKAAFILVLSMPFSIFLTLLFMKLAGLSFNIMSLGGLALGIGMLVDNSVVVLENIDKRVGRYKKIPAVKDIAIYTNEMAGSTFGSTVTSVIVFLPVLFLPGIIGTLYKELALTVSFSLISSFFVSITLIPVLYSLFLQKSPSGRFFVYDSKDGMFALFYRKLLVFVLKKRYILVVVVFLLGSGSLCLLKRVDFRFMPPDNSSRLIIDVIPEPGTGMERIKEISKSIIGRLLKYPEIKGIYCRAGAEPDDTYFLSKPEESRETIHIFITLSDARVAKRLKYELTSTLSVENAAVEVYRPANIILDLLKITGTGKRYIIGMDNFSDKAYYREKIRGEINSSGYFEKVFVKPSGKLREIYLIPKREEIRRAGTSVEQLARIIKGSVYGFFPARITLGGEKYDVRLRILEKERNSIERLGRILFIDKNGNSIPLNKLVKISEVVKNAGLMRIGRRDAIYLCVEEKPSKKEEAAGFLELLEKRYQNMKSVSGSVFHDYLPSIVMTFSVALLLLYLFLGAQFESFFDPLILLAALPLSLIGVVPMLVLGGSSLNLNSALGILVLFGISVNNSIILKNTIRQRAKIKGRVDIDTVVKSSTERLRPILITTVTTIAALIPTAFNIFGESYQSSLALTVIGGLSVSTLLTLFVIPAVSVKSGKERESA